MQRDMELIRQILLAVERNEHGFFHDAMRIEGYSEEQIGYHCYLLGDAGLAVVGDTTGRGDDSPSAMLSHLTWAGHEFLDAAKDDTTWEKAKQRLAGAGKSLLNVPVAVLTAVLIDEAKRRLGIP